MNLRRRYVTRSSLTSVGAEDVRVGARAGSARALELAPASGSATGFRVRAGHVGAAVVDVVADGQQVVRRQLVIDASDEDVAVERRVAVADVVVRRWSTCPARFGSGKYCSAASATGSSRSRGNHVAGKRLARRRVVDGDRLARAVPQIREVALPGSAASAPSRRPARSSAAASAPRSRRRTSVPLLDRAAERPAELVQPDRRLGRREEVAGVERVVAAAIRTTLPRNSFVPERVDIVTTPPVEWPYSAA